MKKINAIVFFSQSKTYQTDWKIRTEYKEGYKVILVTDEISKSTRFGTQPDKKQMQEYATSKIMEVAKGFGIDVEVVFVQDLLVF